MIVNQPSVKFICSCGGLVHEFVEVPSYNSMAEKESDANGFDTYDVTCPHCFAVFEIEFTAHAFGVSAEIPTEPNIDVEVLIPNIDAALEADYEDYLRLFDPTNPKNIFDEAVSEAQQLIAAAHGTAVENDAFYRLMFIQYFSIVEAYLSDHLSKVLFSNRLALVNLVNKHKELSKERLSLTLLLQDKDASTKFVKKHLQAIMYHNFLIVDVHYKLAFGFSIFPNLETKETLIKQAFRRHDCVHRNGCSKDGKKHIVSKKELEELAEAVNQLVLHIEEQIM